MEKLEKILKIYLKLQVLTLFIVIIFGIIVSLQSCNSRFVFGKPAPKEVIKTRCYKFKK